MTGKKWDKLLKLDLVHGDAPKGGLVSPWYMKFMVAIFAIVTGFILINLLTNIFHISFENNPEWAFFLGVIFILIAFVMYIKDKNELLEYFAYSISLVGQILVLSSMNIFFNFDRSHEWIFYLFIALFQFLLIVVMPNLIHKILSSIIFGFLVFAIFSYHGYFYIYMMLLTLITIELWLNEFYDIKQALITRALAYGHFFTLVFLNFAYVFGMEVIESPLNNTDFLVKLEMIELFYSFSLFYLVFRLLSKISKFNIKLTTLMFFMLLLLSFLSFHSQGLTLGLILIVLGFSVYNNILMVFGIASVFVSLFNYYYFLEITLIEKSQLLGVVGISLFTVRWVLLKKKKGANS